MQVVICEDDQLYIDGITQACSLWQRKYPEVGLSVLHFRTPEALLDFWEKRGKTLIDLFFLNTDFPYMNGFELAQEIRKTDAVTPIVFVTASKDYAIAGYELSVYRYLVKPVKNEAIFNCLDHALSTEAFYGQKYLLFDKTGGTLRIPVSDILYLSYGLHSIDIHKSNGAVLTSVLYRSFDYFFSSLPSNRFVRCHRGYIINLLYIDRYTRTKLILRNGEIIPIGKSFQEQAFDTVRRHFSGELL